MRKLLKLLIIIFMILGIALSILNIFSVDNMAKMKNPWGDPTGTWDPTDNTCTGAPLNC